MAQQVRAIKGRIGNLGLIALGMFARPGGRGEERRFAPFFGGRSRCTMELARE